MSQEDLEVRSKVSQSAISRMERGQNVENPGPVGLFAAMHVARILGCTVEELFASDLEAWKRDRDAKRGTAQVANDTDGAA